ncbi:MAG: hypothetical protein JWO87_1553 [Phycisphaerales bacterium]|nr:hypothetical protein [Phycisphaerales bacterium]
MNEDTMKDCGPHHSALPVKRLIQIAAGAVLAFLAGACQEPPYRTEVTPNAQGGVEVHRVAKDTPRPPAAAREASNVSSTPPVDDSPMTAADRAKRIAHLEALVQDMNGEIARLKRAQVAEPSATP